MSVLRLLFRESNSNNNYNNNKSADNGFLHSKSRAVHGRNVEIGEKRDCHESDNKRALTNHACSLLVYLISVITPGRQRALTAFRRYYLLENKLSDRMIKQLLNSVIAKYRYLSVSRRSIIELLATDKSRYFAQPLSIIANYSN